jgi:hypothetical protein
MRKVAGRGNLTEVASTVYNVYHAKKLKEKGFKTKDLAVEKAKEMMEYHMIGK